MPATSLITRIPCKRLAVLDTSAANPPSTNAFLYWILRNVIGSDIKIPTCTIVGSYMEFWQGEDSNPLWTDLDEGFILSNLDTFREATLDPSNLEFAPYQEPGTGQWFVDVKMAAGWTPVGVTFIAHVSGVEQIFRNQNILLGQDWKWAPEEYHPAWMFLAPDAPPADPIGRWGYDNCDANYIPDEATAIALAAELQGLVVAAFGNP